MNTPLAVIGRTGFHLSFLEEGASEETVLVPETPFGDPSPVHIMGHGEIRFAVLSRHGEDGRYNISAPFVNDRANIWALKLAGVEKVISWSAPGSVNESMKPGDVIIPDDIIDETRDGPYTFYENKGLGFIRQRPVFCPEISRSWGVLLSGTDYRLHTRGVYVATQGPRLETPAEIKKFALLGGDLVGMTLVPEVFLARELEICYTALCYSVNYAEGVKDRPTDREKLFEGLLTEDEKKRVDKIECALARLTLEILPEIARLPRNCPCKNAMLRYRLRGDIGDNWREWIN